MLNDFADRISCHWEKVHFVGKTFRCLDSRDVRIEKDCVDALLLQSFNCLATGIVKFPSLPDAKSATT